MDASSSSPSKRCKYQVFLSFRGEDTRKGFTGHLHAALSDAGIRTFLDDNELERAKFIKTQLDRAINGSMISIIVFSKSYADSSWCLDELVKIMECRERLGQQVMPLFYNVDASDVRKQTGSFAQAFKKHEAGKHKKEKVKRWRNALTEAADLCGEDLKNADGHEAKFIKKILGKVNDLVNSKHQLDIEHLVGITSRVKVLSNHLDIENSGSKDVVLMIGILGMGGIGKTTLAKAIYNKFEGSFEGRSFLANVREVIANQPITGLVGLQKQLLNDILKSKGHIKFDSVAKGIEMIRERLPCKRALVIIDDADDLHQLKAIARKRDWFGPGSRIIITTRDKHLLEQVGVDSTYPAQGMDEEEALELFSWHAFKRGYPDQEYLDLSKRVIHYCQGLPLALEVLGSFLNKRTALQWESQLERLERSPHEAITKILRISFDGLPDCTDRNTFLDISCFFIGMDKDIVTQILDGCGFCATLGIPILIERCLVTVSEQNKLMMHDLLRDMGREIVRENACGHPEKFSRLWKSKDVTDVLSDESGTEEIEGVALDLDFHLDLRGNLHGDLRWEFHRDLHWEWHRDLRWDLDLTRFSAQVFTNMKKLRLLHLSNVQLTGEYKDFPKKLIWLCWKYFPLESIPDDFPVQPKLVALDLQRSKLKIVWKDCKLHQKLKILNLSGSFELTKSPNFSKLPNLEELILKYCKSLSEVHSSIGDLVRLSLVNLEDCRSLEDLPLNFYKSKSIKTLLLNRCSGFRNLADGLGDMVSLTILEADDTAIRQIPSSIVKLNKLRILSLSGCRLTEDAIPKDLCSLISLEHLLLGANNFCSLPSLAGLSKLKVLCLNACRKLLAVSDLPTNLYVLKANDCPELETIPDFSKMSNMRELYLRDSVKLTEVPGLYKSLNFMTRIHMEKCTNLTADFRKNILQGWTSCGYGGIFLSGNDIPDMFDSVHDDDIVNFTVPQSDGRNLKGLTLSFGFSSSSERFSLGFRISIKNMTKGTDLEARIIPDCPIEGYYLWQGQLSNDELKLQDGDKVWIEIIVDKWVKVKKTGVSLVWDKFMNENMIDYHLCAYERRPPQNLVNDDIIHVEDDHDMTKSPDFSKFPKLEKLILKGCTWLYKVHSYIGELGRLSLVNLESCNNLEDLPLNFYKSKSIETLLLNGCSRFQNLADGLGDMVSLTILEADKTAIRQIPSSIVNLKKLRILSLSGCWRLTEDAIPKDLCSLISLEHLLLIDNYFRSLPSLAGLSKLKVLCLNACRELRAIPDLPKNLYVLKANGCPELETIPDFSEMSNMRELYLCDSFKLTEVPGLDKSLNSMTRIHMEGCTNLTADFRNNILQGWTSCGYGGIFLSGYDIPDWFHCVHEDNIAYFTVPQSVGRSLKGLTLSFVFSSGIYGCRISIKNMTKGTELDARIKPVSPKNGYHLWQGQLSNDKLKLQDGDKVLIEIIEEGEYNWSGTKVKKAGVSLVWDKFMNENMIDYHLCEYERRQSQNLVNDHDIIHVKYDYNIKKSPDFSNFPNLKKLILKDCPYLSEVHSSIGDLDRLSLVNLEDCRSLEDLPLNFYKSKSIKTLLLNRCSGFRNLADGLGDMVSLTILEADDTAIRQIPSSIVKLNKLRILSLSGCRLTEDAIPKDLCSLISLEHLLLGGNYFLSLPRLAGLSKLKVLCVNACGFLRAIPDLPTNLYVLKANDCPNLETIPDFSKMLNMRELYLSDSFKLTEVPGLDKSLNSMTRIHMEGCTNLTADFRNNILQRWTSCGFGGIYLNGIYDIPEWFKIVSDVDNIVFFEVPQRIMGRDLKGLTICFVYSSDELEDYNSGIGIIVRNLTKQTALHTKIAFASLKSSSEPEEPEDDSGEPKEDSGQLEEPEDDYLWQGQLSNDVLRLQGGDRLSILVRPDDFDFVRVKKTGVHLEWDKVMKENMDPHLYDLETNRDFSGGVDVAFVPKSN
ncbi:hypothetical protein GBA52_000357 [Prunus armeniaca]|nr:hypothetical protein GBA52_000357 [Prunus armeniaca]